jgi:hypothetical protein
MNDVNWINVDKDGDQWMYLPSRVSSVRVACNVFPSLAEKLLAYYEGIFPTE